MVLIVLFVAGLAVSSALPDAVYKNEVETRRLALLLKYITWPNPEDITWPPTLPEEAPWWWPDGLQWPPKLPEDLEWPPTLPDGIVWPPTIPEEAPVWWPENCAWPPQIPESIPENGPCWWPEGLAWPPQIPEFPWELLPDIPWPQLPNFILDQIPYLPNRDNQLHLFTRANPGLSQPIVTGNLQILQNSNFDSSRRTIILVHDLDESALADTNLVLVPSLLQAADVNVILVDWSAGANASPVVSTFYSWLSGNFVARFIRWLSVATESNLENFHLVGSGIGAINVGYIGRVLNREIGYITALNPTRRPNIPFLDSLPPFQPNVARYTEVIHTVAVPHSSPMGHVDFYPNGGNNMPGCGTNNACSKLRAAYYLAESFISGGLIGVECATHQDALNSNCNSENTLNLGGLLPKTGSTGMYHLRTNALPPFSQS